MRILVIDSLPTEEVAKVSFTLTPPTREYIEHSNGILDVFKEVLPEADLVFAHIACFTRDYYGCLFNHQNFNKALQWTLDQGDFDAIYAQAQFYCPEKYKGYPDIVKRYEKEHIKTKKIIHLLGIPIICPAENSAEEKINTVCSPLLGSNLVEYVSSVKNRWAGTVVVKSKKYRYTSELAVIRIKEILNPSHSM